MNDPSRHNDLTMQSWDGNELSLKYAEAPDYSREKPWHPTKAKL